MGTKAMYMQPPADNRQNIRRDKEEAQRTAPRSVKGQSGDSNKQVIQCDIKVRQKGSVLTATGDGNRPPGSLTTGCQGDHMTAYVTFEHQMINAIYGLSTNDAWTSLLATHEAIMRMPGYADSAVWLRQASEKIYTDTKAKKTMMTAENVEEYANILLKIRNRLKYTSRETSGGSTGGQNESVAGGLQNEERRIQRGKSANYPKKDIIVTMWKLFDHKRFETIKKPEIQKNTIEQHIDSLIDTYWRIVKHYKISKHDLKQIYDKYSW